ncbi:very large A-kinase anchor protein [Astyanax mexicanus]|uniref:Very large A-kinase anchor protein n=2 Tax=Astyanax mexicanus TaxID=7994 RepID=A0A8T2KWG3_ASTMX|nr:very large A-kinase anchor protein [Astyanax mexicanus]
MANLKRQRSWHEDFSRNFLRLFSRSRSVEQEKTDTEAENGEEHEDDSTVGQSDDADTAFAPLHHLTMEPAAQTLGQSEQDRLLETHSVDDPEHRVQDNNADRDPLPVTPSALEPSSPPPPVDGFFRRLGSLFLFGRAEPGGADGQSQPGTVLEAQGAVDTQHTDPKTLLTGSTEAQTSVEEGGEQRLKPTELSQSQELSNSAAGPEVKSTGQAKQDIENTQLQEEVQADQDEEGLVDSPSSDEEQERRRALASPPVVTHVTYRGLREIRKMRRKQEVRLHSPISEGEEGQHGAGVGMSAPEEKVETLHGASAGSPCVAASGEGLNYQRHVSQGSSYAPSSSHILEDEGGVDSALSQSALQTHTVARTQPAGLESDLALVHGTSCPGEKSVCLVVDEASEMHVDGLEPLEMASGRETQSLFHSDVLLDPLTAQPLETSHSQLSDTATDSNTHLTDITTVPSSHTCFCLGSDIASNCCQESQLSVTQLDVQDPESNQTYLSSKAEISGQAAWKAELVPKDETTQLGLAEEQLALDDETLQLESKKMVDDILKNALAALEKIDASNRESETPISEELNEGAETLMLMRAGNSMGGSASVECMFREHLPVQADGNPQLNLSDDTLGGRAQADGCRSTPSSGYESIAGSDTDIRSMTMNSDINTSLSGPFGTFCTEPELKEESETEERELCMDGGPVCQNDEIRQNFVHSTLHLKVNLEEREGPEGTEANNELLFQYDLSDSNISHKTNIPSAQQAISESLSGVNKGAEQCAVEEHGVHVCVTQRENDHSGLQNAAKVNTESNNYGNALGLDSGDASSIINNVDLKQVQSISERLSPTGMRNVDSYQLPHISEIRDFSGKEDRPNLSVRQSHVADETLALHLEKPKLASQDPQSGHTQGLFNCAEESDEGPDFALVKTYLATVVEDGPDSGMPSAVPGCSTIKVFVCSATDDQSQDHKPDLLTGPSLHSPGRLASLPISVRAHLDIPGTSSRPQTTDLHQIPGGFTIISEEEELDTVFVNDTGPMLSPSTRRAKAYPFSLSPIYEEESGREDTSRDDLLHVPPATEEEQRSVEQQASSILSLLQSVSERLQSSVYSESEDSEEKLEEPESPQRFLRPLWDRYEDDDNEDAATDEQSSLLLQQQLTGIRLHSEELELEPAVDACSSSSFIPDQKTTSGIPFEEPGAQHCKPTLNNNINNVVRKANTPFYEYLKSNIVPSLDTEKQASKAFHHNEGSPTSSTLTEMEAFGKINPRPTLLHIYAGATPSGTRRDVCEDVEDASQVLFPQEATIQARRGCWLLYVEPGYRGSCIVLEEGQTMRTTGETTKSEEHSAPALLSVGSIKRAVKDDTVPEIHLSSASNPERERVCLHSEADHVDANGPVHLSDLSVRSGCWLAYDGTAFTGNHTVLEARGLTTPVLQNSPISCVRSLRPLRMGGLRVRNPLDPKVVLYAQPLFQGECRELLDNTPSLGPESGLAQVSSLRVAGGVWVGYSCEKYRGQQCVLEEGEYSDCSAFFSEPGLTLRSCRFLQADFIEPEVSLKSSGVQMEILDQDVADLQQNGLEQGTDAIHVKSGVWVAYSGRYYTGEQCVLEKGQHPGTLDWGSSRQSSPLSIRPVRREVCGEEEAPKFLLRVYSKPGFAGESREFGTEVADCGGLIPMSFRVILGSWLLYDEKDYCGNQFVLGEGFYPDLTSCGCMTTAIKSLKPIPYSFSEPSISLFSLSSFEGLETVADSPMETMDNFFTQSLKVNSGLWVVYEFGQFRGCQMLLQMGEYPCWGEYSSWDTIGSLQPLRQRRTYMQVRNGALGMALTAERTSDPLSPAKLLLRPADCSLDTQHWIYSQALLKSKVGKGCLSVIGGKASVGARVALWEEHGRIHQRWRLNKNGTISPHLDFNLVLDRRGGSGIDKDHLILSELCTDKASQYWDIEVL